MYALEIFEAKSMEITPIVPCERVSNSGGLEGHLVLFHQLPRRRSCSPMCPSRLPILVLVRIRTMTRGDPNIVPRAGSVIGYTVNGVPVLASMI